MHRKSGTVIKPYGVEGSKKLFLQLAAGENPNYPQGVADNTHFSPLGAHLMASLAVEGMREQKLGLVKELKRPAPVYAGPWQAAEKLFSQRDTETQRNENQRDDQSYWHF